MNIESTPGRRAASVAEARRSVFHALPPPRPDEVELVRAAGRVLREDVVASEELWPVARAAMDGVAVRFDDIARVTPEEPALLPLVASAYCGEQTMLDLPRGSAARSSSSVRRPKASTYFLRERTRGRGRSC